MGLFYDKNKQVPFGLTVIIGHFNRIFLPDKKTKGSGSGKLAKIIDK